MAEYEEYLERMADAERVNEARDDAAALALINEMTADLAQYRQEMENARDGVSMLQVAEGTLQTVSDNLTRMRELAMQAQGGLYSEEQIALMQREFENLDEANAQIGMMTAFNGIALHRDGTEAAVAASEDPLSFDMQSVPAVGGDLTTDPAAAAAAVDEAIREVTAYRGRLGEGMHRLEAQFEGLAEKAENILEARTRIAGTDLAREVASNTAARIEAAVYARQAHSQSVRQIAEIFFG